MNKRGFTIFFAVLVASLALAVGLSIYDLLVRELALSQIATQSQYAIYAADTGAECALYWDAKAPSLGGSPSVFGTSTTASWGASPVNCASNSSGVAENITTQGPPTVDWSQYYNATYGCPQNPTSAWCIAADANDATTTFSITITAPAQTYCATVVVAKVGNPPQTTIVSHGYNTCSANGTVRLERALQVNY